MKRIDTYIYNRAGILPLLVVWLCLGVLLSSCSRRPLEDEGGTTALVPFHIDWSKSGLDVSKMSRASIWFFPDDGSASFEWRLQGDLSATTVPLAAGKYAIVVFNETIDDTDWKSIVFEGKQKYETFTVSTAVGDFSGLFGRADQTDVRKTPDAMASWSLDEFEVTPEMITRTRGLSSRGLDDQSVDKSLETLSAITPLPLTVHVHVQAYVTNLKSAFRCSVALEGATGKISLATGRPVKGTVTHIFPMTSRRYDDETSFDGTIEAEPVLLFKLQEQEVNYALQLDFELHDGTFMPPERFDITEQIDKENLNIEVAIGVAGADPEKDHPIILPKINIESNVGVDGWEEDVQIPIH